MQKVKKIETRLVHFFQDREVGISKKKQESKKERKHAFEKERDQEKKLLVLGSHRQKGRVSWRHCCP